MEKPSREAWGTRQPYGRAAGAVFSHRTVTARCYNRLKGMMFLCDTSHTGKIPIADLLADPKADW